LCAIIYVRCGKITIYIFIVKNDFSIRFGPSDNELEFACFEMKTGVFGGHEKVLKPFIVVVALTSGPPLYPKI
jgi:hypothetical protein